MLFCLLTLEMLKGKFHLKEVESEKFHEEKDGKERREDTSNI